MTTPLNGVAPAFSRAAAALRVPLPESSSHPASMAASPVRDNRYRMLVGGMLWVLIVLMIVPEGFDYNMLAAGDNPTSGGLASRLLWLALLGFGLVVIAARTQPAWRLMRRLNPFLLAFVVLAIASVTWSIDPPLTARRSVRLLAIFAMSAAFVLAGWHALRFQNVLRPILTMALLGSIIFGLAWPHLAIHQEADGVLAGAWHGLANHKNGLGNIACIALVLWLHGGLSRQVRIPMAMLGGGIALACLLLARSSTSIITTVFTLLFLVMLMRSPPTLRRYMPWLVTLSVAALLVYSLALLQVIPGLGKLLGPIGTITGKDMTFTGRTDIWDIMFAEISLHPLLGAGYGAFWAGPYPGTPSYEFIHQLRFYPGSAHNGYLEILNDLGVIGLLVLLGFLACFVAQSLRLMAVDHTQAALYLAFFLQQAITNLSESRWLSVQSIDFVIMTLATAALAQSLLVQRQAVGLRRLAPDMTIARTAQSMQLQP